MSDPLEEVDRVKVELEAEAPEGAAPDPIAIELAEKAAKKARKKTGKKAGKRKKS